MKRYRNLNDKKVPKPLKRYIFAFLIIVISVMQLFLLNSLATAGSHLTDTEAKIDQIAKENDILESQITSASSMTTIFNKAQEIGLSQNPTTLSLVAPLPVAQVEKSFN